MTPDAIDALITVGGMLGVAVVAAVVQVKVTRQVIASELDKMALQLDRESAHRRREKRDDELRGLLAELLACTDPEVRPEPDHTRAVVLVNHAQLLLQPSIPAEARLNGALSGLGFASADHRRSMLGLGDRGETMRALIAMQSELTEAARAVFAARETPASARISPGDQHGDAAGRSVR